MRCMSCGANIPPEWVNAIQRNSCPGCGNLIMDEQTEELLHELANAMERMPNDPQGVAGWLLSNYRFQKMGSAEPVDRFHRKGGIQAGEVDNQNLKVDPTYNEFIKRNNAGNLVARGEQLAKLKQSNSKFAEFASVIQDVSDPYGDDTTSDESEDKPDASDQKALIELQSEGLNPFAGTTGGGVTDLSQVINPRDVDDMFTKGQDAPAKLEAVLEQSEEGRRVNQRERFKRLKAQDAISGAGDGSFTRSG